MLLIVTCGWEHSWAGFVAILECNVAKTTLYCVTSPDLTVISIISDLQQVVKYNKDEILNCFSMFHECSHVPEFPALHGKIVGMEIFGMGMGPFFGSCQTGA